MSKRDRGSDGGRGSYSYDDPVPDPPSKKMRPQAKPSAAKKPGPSAKQEPDDWEQVAGGPPPPPPVPQEYGQLEAGEKFKGVKLHCVPLTYNKNILGELLESCGASPSALISAEWQHPCEQDAPGTTTWFLSFYDDRIAKKVSNELAGQQVADEHDVIHELKTTIRDFKEGMTIAEQNLLPSVYISDLPVDYKEREIRQLHASLCYDTSRLVSVKILLSKDPTRCTTCAIGRYIDEQAAEDAIWTLKGHEVSLSNNQKRHIGARMAKAASWMVKTGVAGKQSALTEDPKNPGAGTKNAWKHHAEPAHWPHAAQMDAIDAGNPDSASGSDFQPPQPGVQNNQLPLGTSIKGIVKTFEDTGGYGFITVHGGPDVFVHRRVIADGMSLTPGSEVTFTVTWDYAKKKYSADYCAGATSAEVASLDDGMMETWTNEAGEGVDPTNIYISSLPSGIGVDIVREMFAQIGEVVSCKVLPPKKGKWTDVGFVRMKNPEDAQQAIQCYHDQWLDGAKVPLCVELAKKTQSPATSPPVIKPGNQPNRPVGHQLSRPPMPGQPPQLAVRAAAAATAANAVNADKEMVDAWVNTPELMDTLLKIGAAALIGMVKQGTADQSVMDELVATGVPMPSQAPSMSPPAHGPGGGGDWSGPIKVAPPAKPFTMVKMA